MKLSDIYNHNYNHNQITKQSAVTAMQNITAPAELKLKSGGGNTDVVGKLKQNIAKNQRSLQAAIKSGLKSGGKIV